MAKAQVGNGKVTDFGKITGAELVSRDDDGTRKGFTDRYTCTKATEPNFGTGLAGGDNTRFLALRSRSKECDLNVHKINSWESLPGQSQK